MDTDDLPIHFSWFEDQGQEGKAAIGDPETMPWSNFTGIIEYYRREGDKNGPNFIPAKFRLEPDGRHVRRKGANLIARTAIALDVELNKKTGKIPPALDVAVERVKNLGWAGVLYTSHNNRPDNVRYRAVLPLSSEIDHTLPAVEVVADFLDLLGVVDMSKRGASSLFFLPSCPYNTALHWHQTVVLPGAAIDAAWIREAAGTLQAARQAEADRIAEAAQAEAAARRAAKLASGFNPDDSLIEKIRGKLDDLADILAARRYDKQGTKWRHPNSQSGSYGADIATFGGIERVFSHNGTDPLHADNLPAWCGVTALDAFDATIILDYAGDRTRALKELGEQFGLIKKAETWTPAHTALGGCILKMVRRKQLQAYIETVALREGRRRGLSEAEILRVAQWAATKTATREAA